MKKILVTGGSGFLGEKLVLKLLEKGNHVINFDLIPSRINNQNLEFIQGDIRNPNLLKKITQNVNSIVHCVAQVPLSRNKKNFLSVNIDGTHNLLKAALDNEIKKVVYVSSSAVYGIPKSNPINENSPRVPAEEYGLAKLEGELLCEKYRKLGLDVSIVRPRTILGPHRLGIFGILFNWIKDGSNVFVIGSGHNLYQFIHVDDLVEAIILVMSNDQSTDYNIGAHGFTTMRDSIERLCIHAKTNSKVKSLPKSLAINAMALSAKLRITPFAPYHWKVYSESIWFDTSKAANELKWRANFSSVEALIDNYEWYKNNLNKDSSKSLSIHQVSAAQGALGLLKFFSKRR